MYVYVISNLEGINVREMCVSYGILITARVL